MDWNKKTVAELIPILEAYELPTDGKKTDLIQRIKSIPERLYKASLNPDPAYPLAQLPKDVRHRIAVPLMKSNFYFLQKFESAKVLSDPELLKLKFSPAQIEFFIMTRSPNGPMRENKIVFSGNGMTSTKALQKHIYQQLQSIEGLKKIIFKKEHLNAIVYLDGHGRLDLHVLIFKPNSEQRSAYYELKLHGDSGYTYKQPEDALPKSYVFNFIQFIIRHPTDANYSELWYGLGDVLLGFQWIQTFFLRGGGAMSALMEDKDILVNEIADTKMSLNDLNDIRSSIKTRLSKIMPTKKIRRRQ
jgi:hypothetical protein